MRGLKNNLKNVLSDILEMDVLFLEREYQVTRKLSYLRFASS